MNKKLTVATLVVSLSLGSCVSTVQVQEAREYGIERIDRITLNSGETHHFALDSIDEMTNRVIGRTKGYVLEYKQEDIKFFQSTKDGFTALIVATVIGAAVLVYELTNLRLDFSDWR